jgi:hypothetical protein
LYIFETQFSLFYVACTLPTSNLHFTFAPDAKVKFFLAAHTWGVGPIARLFSPTVDRSLSSSFSFSFSNRSTGGPSTDEVTGEVASALGSAETVAVVGGDAVLPAVASGLATRSSVYVRIWAATSGPR